MHVKAGRGGARGERARLSRADWVEGATAVLADEGLFAVSIDRLALHLGVTKGSFYSHFDSRDDLIGDVLERFQLLDTDEVIARSGMLSDARKRLSCFLDYSFERSEWGRVFGALCAVCSDPRVEQVMRSVAEKRIGFAERALRESGLTRPAARERGTMMFTTYAGFWRLVTAYPEWGYTEPRRLRRYADHVKATLIPPRLSG